MKLRTPMIQSGNQLIVAPPELESGDRLTRRRVRAALFIEEKINQCKRMT